MRLSVRVVAVSGLANARCREFVSVQLRQGVFVCGICLCALACVGNTRCGWINSLSLFIPLWVPKSNLRAWACARAARTTGK